MKRQHLIAAAVLLTAGYSAQADIIVDFGTSGADVTSFTVNASPLSERAFPDGKSRHDSTVAVVDGKATIPMESVNAAYYFTFTPNADNVDLEIFAAPEDSISVAVNENEGNLDYVVTGSKLMEGINDFNNLVTPIIKDFNTLAASDLENKEELMNNLTQEYGQKVEAFLKENLNAPVAPLVLTEISDPKQLLEFYEQFGPEAKSSILYPVATRASEKAKKKLAYSAMPPLEGNPAPGFKLKDMKGKDVSLENFRGKWVVLDFWGSWCKWCIKGIPELRTAYERYRNKMEVIGIDCRDTMEAWTAAVKKYQLPWVNVYNPEGSDLLMRYRVEGFPTKVIISPDGIIMDIVVGEDPEFYTKLAKYM